MAPFLHGDLDVVIIKADDLFNRENFGLGPLGRVIAKIARRKVDAYVNIILAGDKVATTEHVFNTISPVWDDTFTFKPCHPGATTLTFEIKDQNIVGATHLGNVEVDLTPVILDPDHVIEGAFDIHIIKKGWRKRGVHGKLHLRITFKPLLPQDPDRLTDINPETPDVYFSARPGNRLRLYSTAHSSPETSPGAAAVPFDVHGCWQDIAAALEDAQEFIYITGWSVHPVIRLVRHKPGAAILGDILNAAAERGVQVKIICWDDRSSSSYAPWIEGVMGTYDEQARQWFKSNAPLVDFQVKGRTGGSGQSIIEGGTASACFSHHQKTVMCDVADDVGRRKVVAFVGGLDLTKGRYDTAEHALFHRPDGRFEDDYDNPSFDTKEGARPRQPWQDVHCRIDGPAAEDVVANFIERWQNQVQTPIAQPRVDFSAEYKHHDDDPEAFTVQILRSIDGRSTNFDQAKASLLFPKKGREVDRSILLGYVHHVRRAQRFVYIENQYFLGSCYMWNEERDSRCSHTLPAELVAKIVSKIRVRQPFAAYIVVPMFPEGDPSADSVAAILRFQKLTMECMYEKINEVILEQGLTTKPTDYLSFFTLANREADLPDESNGGTGPATVPLPSKGNKGAPETGELSGAHRRFPIYVHSKLMIVDDEVAIIGSANINMRSLSGTRDTEIAAALWQPAHMLRVADANQPGAPDLRGQVHGFRMSLWLEHLIGGHPHQHDVDLFRRPELADCVRRVQELSRANYEAYMGEHNVSMRAHLLPYPTVVVQDGERLRLESVVESIPDFPGASLFGKETKLPKLLTT